MLCDAHSQQPAPAPTPTYPIKLKLWESDAFSTKLNCCENLLYNAAAETVSEFRQKSEMRPSKKGINREENLEDRKKPNKCTYDCASKVNYCALLDTFTALSRFRRLRCRALSRRYCGSIKSSGSSNSRSSRSGIGCPNALALRPCRCLPSAAALRCSFA